MSVRSTSRAWQSQGRSCLVGKILIDHRRAHREHVAGIGVAQVGVGQARRVDRLAGRELALAVGQHDQRQPGKRAVGGVHPAFPGQGAAPQDDLGQPCREGPHGVLGWVEGRQQVGRERETRPGDVEVLVERGDRRAGRVHLLGDRHLVGTVRQRRADRVVQHECSWADHLRDLRRYAPRHPGRTRRREDEGGGDSRGAPGCQLSGHCGGVGRATKDTAKSPACIRGDGDLDGGRAGRIHRRMGVIVHLVLRASSDLLAPFLNPSPAADKHSFWGTWALSAQRGGRKQRPPARQAVHLVREW